MKIDDALHTSKRGTIEALRRDRLAWWTHWRTLADYYLPRRYVWLLSGSEQKRATSRNEFILDNTGTSAARVLASGMMNGITSPSRPWFKLSASGFDDDLNYAARVWLDEVARRMLLAMAETNFYNAMAIVYLDLVVFGTSACLIYEDYENTFRCYNSPLGEFYIAQSDRQQVDHFAREFTYKVHQVVAWWGVENCSDTVKDKYHQGGARLQDDVDIVHLIEPNDKRSGQLDASFDTREYYWEKAGPLGYVLSVKGFKEFPGIFPRWELCANDSYGSSPAMDALGDVIQLQHETKKKAQGLDKMISPPIIADIQLQHRPTALLPNGITYVAGVNNVGAKPIYTVQLPLDQMTADLLAVQGRIRDTFHNDLFKMISQLETVRSAAEIGARQEEKLVLLGPVLERFENEALDPAIKRIFSIMDRAGLLPPPPKELQGADIEIQYVSILTTAQTAAAAYPTERYLQVIGNVSAVYPKALNIPDWEEMLRNYGRDIGVRSKDLHSLDDAKRMGEEQDQIAHDREVAAQGTALAQGAKTLSEADLGGGQNVLQNMFGG